MLHNVFDLTLAQPSVFVPCDSTVHTRDAGMILHVLIEEFEFAQINNVIVQVIPF